MDKKIFSNSLLILTTIFTLFGVNFFDIPDYMIMIVMISCTIIIIVSFIKLRLDNKEIKNIIRNSRMDKIKMLKEDYYKADNSDDKCDKVVEMLDEYFGMKEIHIQNENTCTERIKIASTILGLTLLSFGFNNREYIIAVAKEIVINLLK